MSDHPHTPNTADTADLVTWLRWVGEFFLAGERVTQAADEIERLSAIVAAVDALHQPFTDSTGIECCVTCVDEAWPCPTHLAIHPKDNR